MLHDLPNSLSANSKQPQTLAFGTWTNLPDSSVVGGGKSMVITDTNAISNADRRFYRLRQN
jgi:hypothetical protein